MPVIPFYGAERPDRFAIERRAMDREGRVIAALDRRLPPTGRILDVGAGDGFTAGRLATPRRRVIPMEPALQMISSGELTWVRGSADAMPFRDGAFAGAYATWAYFFPTIQDIEPGLAEMHRVVIPGGPIAIVDNLGDDEFTALSPSDISSDPQYWTSRGFTAETVETSFEFDNLENARRLLGFYFAERGRAGAAQRITFRVVIYTTGSRGG